jgi:hypothetical protein
LDNLLGGSLGSLNDSGRGSVTLEVFGAGLVGAKDLDGRKTANSVLRDQKTYAMNLQKNTSCLFPE